MSAADVDELYETLDRAVRDGFAAARLAASVLDTDAAGRIFRATVDLDAVLGELSRRIGEGEL